MNFVPYITSSLWPRSGTSPGQRKSSTWPSPPSPGRSSAWRRSLGSPLLIRGGRQLQLTEEGRFLQARGREILQLMENTQQQLGPIRISISMAPSVCAPQRSPGPRCCRNASRPSMRRHPTSTSRSWRGTAPRTGTGWKKTWWTWASSGSPSTWNPMTRLPFGGNPGASCAAGTTPWRPSIQRPCPWPAWGEVPLMLPARQSLQADIHNWLGQFLPRRNVFCLYNSIFSILGLAQRGWG